MQILIIHFGSDLVTDYHRYTEGEKRMPRTILTGPPGSGKTTLLERLTRETGRPTLPEAARAEIAENGLGPDLQKRIYERALRQERDAPENAILDRSHLDALAYGYEPDEPPPRLGDAEVWLLTHKPERYKRDAERRESPEEAKALEDALERTYKAHGYRVRRIDAANPPEATG